MYWFRLLVLVSVFLKVQNFRFDKGCEVKQSWEEVIKWPEIHISSWLPKNKTKFMELEIFFKNKEELTDNDEIIFNKENCTLVKTRDLEKDSTLHNISVVMQEGWNDFVVKINGNYSVWHVGNGSKSLLVEVPTELTLKSLKVKSNYITLNCQSNVRAWQVSGKPVEIPFDSSKEQRIAFYSDVKVRPFIRFGNSDIQLRWDGKSLTELSDAEPLPNFRLLNVTILCVTQESITCTIKERESGKKLRELLVRNLPESMIVGGKSDDHFSVLLEREHTAQKRSDYDQENQINAAGVVLTIFLVFAILAIAVLSYKLYQRSKVTRKTKRTNIENGEIHEVSPLLQPSDNDFAANQNENILVNAVVDSSFQKAKTILAEGGSIDSKTCEEALVEAHLLCKKDMIEVLSSRLPLERERLIQLVQKEFSNRVNSVFQAAQKGSYSQGVAKLLTTYELPATIRNEEGLSLLHIIASTKYIDDGPPLWSAEDVRLFWKNHTFYPNAVNFKGQTCLHLLSSKASHSKKTVSWDSQEMTAEDAWLKLAEMLVEFKCDPSIRDTKGQLSHECAREMRNIKLSDYLEKNCKEPNQRKKKKLNLVKVVKEAEKGKTNSLRNMLAPHHQNLPLESSNNPLTVAITRGLLETVLLLLSSGAYICGRSRVSITALEAAHGVKSLPAIFPAIMRRECINRLSFELKIIAGSSDNLLLHVENLISNTERGSVIPLVFGDESQTDEEKSKEARKLLFIAAKLGLTLTCQMFGLLNVSLHTFPHEEKPVTEAVHSRNNEIMYVFSRDLQMTIFPHVDESKLPKGFIEDLWGHEFRQLNQAFSKSENEKWMGKIQEVRKKGSNLEMIDKEVMAVVAQLGLTYIFHVIKPKIDNFDINSPVDDFTGCTMLHIAAMHGQQRMVEYLLHDTTVVDVMCRCKKGLTAADWAAVRGNKDCMNYLLFCMKDSEQSDGESVATKYLSAYESQIKEYKNFFISFDTGLEVWSTPLEKDKARLLLENNFQKNEVQDPSSFVQFIESFSSDINDTNSDLLHEMEHLLTKVSETDKGFLGNVVAFHSSVGGLKMPVDSLRIYWEVTSKEFNDFKVQCVSKDELNLSVNFRTSALDKSFKQRFYDALTSTLKDYEFQSQKIWLSYPCIKQHAQGAILFLVMQDEAKESIRLMKALLVPVLKTDYLESKNQIFVHKAIRGCLQEKSLVFIANMNKDQWTLIPAKLENEILRRLNRDQLLVLTGCKLLMKILYSCWWLPRIENRRHNYIWHSYVCGLTTLTPNELSSFFLEELNNSRDEDWAPEKHLDRVISVLKRAKKPVSGGEILSQNISRMFVDSNYSTFKARYVVDSTVQILEDLKIKMKNRNEQN